ncbi:hypothetical protein [Amycolatopsis sp. cmx-11-51]
MTGTVSPDWVDFGSSNDPESTPVTDRTREHDTVAWSTWPSAAGIWRA